MQSSLRQKAKLLDEKKTQGGVPGVRPDWVVAVESMVMTRLSLRVVTCWRSYHSESPVEPYHMSTPAEDRSLTWETMKMSELGL